jgi:hypothetical protein
MDAYTGLGSVEGVKLLAALPGQQPAARPAAAMLSARKATA